MTAGRAAQIPECVCLLPFFHTLMSKNRRKNVKNHTYKWFRGTSTARGRESGTSAFNFFYFFLMMSPVAGVSSRISSRQKKTNSAERRSKCHLKCCHQTAVLKGLTASSRLQQGGRETKREGDGEKRERRRGFVFLPVSKEEEEKREGTMQGRKTE